VTYITLLGVYNRPEPWYIQVVGKEQGTRNKEQAVNDTERFEDMVAEDMANGVSYDRAVINAKAYFLQEAYYSLFEE
jgi:hypothetical protein